MRRKQTALPAGDEIGTAQPLGVPTEHAAAVLPFIQAAATGGILLGRYQTARAFASLSRAAMLRSYEALKADGSYRLIAMSDAHGNSIHAETLEQFCLLAFGRSYRAMEEDLQNTQMLGDALYDAAETLCLRRADMRAMRALPAPERAKIESAIAGGSDSKAVRALITDLVEDLQAARRQADTTAAKLDALQDTVASQADDVARLKRENKALREFVPSDDAAAQSRQDEVVIAEMQEAQRALLDASARIGMLLDDARLRAKPLSRACCERLRGLVESELRRWYAYLDMADAAIAASKQQQT